MKGLYHHGSRYCIRQKTQPLQDVMRQEFYSSTFQYNLVDTPIDELVDIAIHQNVVCLNDQAFYLLNLKDHKHYQSLIFHQSGDIVKSKESTSTIMLRFFRQKDSSYSSACELGKLLGIHQKCPYLIENCCFAPDKGFTKNNVNWIGFHHVGYFEGGSDRTTLKINTFGELTIPLKVERVKAMVHKCSLMAFMQQSIANFLTQQYSFLDDYSANSNIITQHIQKLNYQLPLPKPFEAYHFLEQQKVVQLMKNILGLDCPTKEEIETLLPSLKTIKEQLKLQSID